MEPHLVASETMIFFSIFFIINTKYAPYKPAVVGTEEYEVIIT